MRIPRRVAYLSGPMSGVADHNFPAFRECASRLRQWTDWHIVSPVELELNANFTPGSLSTEEYLKADIRELLECDTIVRLPGWQNSYGAGVELAVAEAIGCDVYDYVPGSEKVEGLIFVHTQERQRTLAVSGGHVGLASTDLT